MAPNYGEFNNAETGIWNTGFWTILPLYNPGTIGILDNTRTLDNWEYCTIPEQQWNAKNPRKLEYWTTPEHWKHWATLYNTETLNNTKVLEYWTTLDTGQNEYCNPRQNKNNGQH
ncbi:hypothetical protein Glove_309g165 [Diversispora epigaea]|uniref:Uncharacterized protein n=1 Tax=Diversispora epigaea TaxID=1348612 RepID=A0A397HS80_9GLOM|nr:hypothetical protein Glove_309g165 [Diversispora epigaea]